jgi:hypothetical protein
MGGNGAAVPPKAMTAHFSLEAPAPGDIFSSQPTRKHRRNLPGQLQSHNSKFVLGPEYFLFPALDVMGYNAAELSLTKLQSLNAK